MRRDSAGGATINVTTLAGCGSTLGTIYNVGCQVHWQAAGLPACSSGNCHQDYYIDADAATATAVGTPMVTAGQEPYGGAGGPGVTQTFSNSGTYVLATLNTNTNQWDAIVYITVGSATYFDTFSDSSDKNEQTTFVASNANTVYIYASGLPPTDSYVVYVESTSVTGYCAFMAPTANPTPGPTLCNPLNSPGENAVGGFLNVPWNLSNGLTPGTYSIVIYDLTKSNRLAQRQVVLTGSASQTISLTPVGGNPSPNPIPAGTPTTAFAFDGVQDESDKGITIQATSLPASTPYTVTISDPNGYVVTSSSQNSNAAGLLSWNWAFSQAQSPQNYIGHTYTISLQNKSTLGIASAQAFKILGYNVQSQFNNPTGPALGINAPATSTTSGVIFTNAGDSVWGTGNGDPISEIQFDMGSQGITASLDSNATSCGANCTSEMEVDSLGGAWLVTDITTTNGANADSTITLTPVVKGYALAVNATILVPNMTFTNPPGSHCKNGCTLTVSELPQDGLTWSQTTQTLGGNNLYITNGFGSTYSSTGHVVLYGQTKGGVLTANQDAHGFIPNFMQALYDQNEPFVAIAGTQDVLAYTIKNTSSAGSGAITKLQFALPSGINVASAAIDPNSPSTWQVQACPGGTPANVLCIQQQGSNAGISANGGVETIYIDVNPPSSSFAYTDVTATVTSPSTYPVAPDATNTVFAGSSAATTVDSTALGGISLDSAKITPLVAPGTVGANTSPSLQVSVQNATTAQDTNPDSIDAVAIDVPTTNGLSNISTTTPGWSYLGSTISGANTRYWFGLCAAQFVAADGPATNPPPPLSASLPSCGQVTENASALAPGATLTVSAKTTVTTSNVTMTEYAHGANGDGWSKGSPMVLTVNSIAVNAGFTNAGTYGSPALIATNTTPTTAADTSATFGNSYVYTISNVSSGGSGQNVTGAIITIPGLDTSGSNGADSSNIAWTITAPPTLTLSGGAANCSVTSYSSASAGGADGSIVIGGTGCTIPPGASIAVNFPARAPYRINDTYNFTTTFTGGNPACTPSCNASPAWFSDSDMQVLLSANLSVTVNPGPGPGGSHPSPNCLPCAFTPGMVDYGTVSNGQTVTGTDVVLVSVYTDAANQDPWAVYVSTNVNPANTGTPTNELLSAVDQTTSNQAGEGLNFDNTSFAVIPTSGAGTKLVDTGAGANPRRLPYDIVTSYQISIQGGATTPQISTVTFTFIAQ